jgi:hypothetical protein
VDIAARATVGGIQYMSSQTSHSFQHCGSPDRRPLQMLASRCEDWWSEFENSSLSEQSKTVSTKTVHNFCQSSSGAIREADICRDHLFCPSGKGRHG